MVRTITILVLGSLVLTFAFAVHVWRQVHLPLTLPAGDQQYILAPGIGINRLISDLVDRGWIQSAVALRVYTLVTQDEGTIKAGEYLLEQGTTPLTLVKALRSGQVRQYHITFPEGWRSRQFLDHLGQAQGLRHSIEELSEKELLESLGITLPHLEGQFFPDTYQYVMGTSDLAILMMSHLRMKEVRSKSWSTRQAGLPYQNADEALIMASIIEKETGHDTERDLIAAVFVNRLVKGMRLQSDPTTIYGLGERFDGNLRKADLEASTPYNTYVYRGLPPTPICNPGERSIQAALNPAMTNALYFVARGNGTSEFSETLAEHNRAVRKYQLDSGNR